MLTTINTTKDGNNILISLGIPKEQVLVVLLNIID